MSEAKKSKLNADVADRLDGVVMRRELDTYLSETAEKAAHGVCEGGCGEHKGEVMCVRVAAEDGYDWGYFAYCETARKTDRENGLRVIPAGV